MNLVMKDLMESKKKNLKEATNTGYTIEDLERLLKIDEDTEYMLTVLAQPKSEDVAFAWDNSISVVDGRVHIEGNLQPGGPESGTVHIECRFASFKGCYDLICDIYALDNLDIPEEDKDFVRSMCDSY